MVILVQPVAILVDRIFDRVQLDLIFGLPVTEEGYCRILVIVEALSKYPVAFPIKTKSAIEVSGLLWYYICVFGPMKSILTDCGKEFTNKIIKQMLSNVGVESKTTAAYNPRCNGMSEKFGDTLVNSIRKHCANRTDWAKWVDYVLLAYRTKVNCVTKVTPFEVMFGRKMQSFGEWQQNPANEEQELANRINEIRKLVENTQPNVKSSIQLMQIQQKKIQGKRHTALDQL